jgi:hypothetical protein
LLCDPITTLSSCRGIGALGALPLDSACSFCGRQVSTAVWLLRALSVGVSGYRVVTVCGSRLSWNGVSVTSHSLRNSICAAQSRRYVRAFSAFGRRRLVAMATWLHFAHTRIGFLVYSECLAAFGLSGSVLRWLRKQTLTLLVIRSHPWFAIQLRRSLYGSGYRASLLFLRFGGKIVTTEWFILFCVALRRFNR